ncbi:ElyC/SanA/YdcF family protein, partial [Hungatella sp.]|uniref:SanA/YdcF family protein n=1 Tax=Hungatella sp. TaxID=2613924 RepID=UPI002A821D6A
MKKLIKKVFITLIVLGVAGIVCLAGVNTYMIKSTEKRILTQEEAAALGADCILVLGAGVHPDGNPSNMLEDRLLRGIELYDAGASQKLLMSGDHGRKNYDEVNVMKQFAVARGVPSEDVFMDHAGFSTNESMSRARDVLQADKVIIVTQRYHLYRAL